MQKMSTIQGSLLLGIALLCQLATGCGEPSKLAKISGTVSVDGKLVEAGSISFVPVDGMAQTTGTDIKAGGKYDSDIPIGNCKVEIRVPKKTGSKKLYDTPDSPVQDTFAETLPTKYNESTELQFEAARGKNEKNWELSTK